LDNFRMAHMDLRNRDTVPDNARPTNLEGMLQSLPFLGSST